MTVREAIPLPFFESYGDYTSSNYGRHTIVFRFPNSLSIYFSYDTPVAFSFRGETVCRENEWSVTTGKHLNWIEPRKSKRLPGAEFEKRLASLFE
jgi:hypothetical protein